MASPSFASGFRSLSAEVQLDSLPLEGEIPGWLSGHLFRTGPAKFEVEDQTFNHWFDGLAMLHRFGFDAEGVSYANRFVESDAYTRARESGEISMGEFATDPCRGIFGRVMSMFSPDFTDNPCVNLTKLGERFVAMTETPMPIEFDPETLETVGHLDYTGNFDGGITTAHPHFDEGMNRELNYLVEYGRKSTYRIVATDPDTLERSVVGEAEVDRPSYMHSFGMSENYVIIAFYPFVVNPIEMLTSDKPFIESFKWKPERETRLVVMRKSDGEIVDEFRAAPRFSFHHVNAFEKDDEILVDIAAYRDPSIIDDLYLERLRNAEPVQMPDFERFRLKDGEDRAEIQLLSDARFELPRINYSRCSGQEYGCVWGCTQHVEGNFVDALVRIDVESGEYREWHESGCYPGEPVFAEKPNPEAEDDGVVLSVVFDAEDETSFLLVLDAHDFTEIARARVPHHIPFNFHGQYYA